MKHLTITALFLLGILVLYGQQTTPSFSWYGALSKTNQNFFEIRESILSKKGLPGFEMNDFEKWDYFWKHRINEDGSFPKEKALYLASEAALQKKNKELMRGEWTCVGPKNIELNGSWTPGIGRINVITEDPNNSNIIYAGGPSGGLWRSVNDGKKWEPLTDHLSFIGVSAIAIDKHNTDIIYIATGDDDGGVSPGIGVWKSENAGKSWKKTGLNGEVEGLGCEILIDPTNSNNLWVATSEGVYYSSDGSENWYKALGIEGEVRDLQLNPGDPGIIYAATGERFFRSSDGGRAFEEVVISFPLTSKRICISVTPASPNYVYVLGAHTGNQYNGIFRSMDAGKTFEEININKPRFDSGKPDFALSLAVSDEDPNVIYRGCRNIYKSEKGGDELKKITNWSNYYSDAYVHGNIHYLKVIKGRVYVGSDGGAFRSSDGGKTFENLSNNGLVTGQFVKITSHPLFEGAIVAGLIDNGGFYKENNKWYNFIGETGIGVAISRVNKNRRFGITPKALGFYMSVDEESPKPMASLPGGGSWATPIEEVDDGSLLSGGQYLFQYHLKENHWVKLGEQKFENYLDVIEISPSNSNVIYVADDRSFYVSTDKGNTWSSANLPNQGFISSIEVDEEDPNKVWVTSRGRVFKSKDGGESWENMSEGLLDIAVNRIKKAKGLTEELYLATDLGVMYRNKEMKAWETYSNGMANVMVMDISLNDKSGLIRAATFGRGIWESEMGPTVSVPQNESVSLHLNTYPNPVGESLNVEVQTNTPGNYQLEIWTLLGQKIEEVSLGYISVALKERLDFNYKRGVYFLKLKNENQEITRKIIKH